MKTPTTPQLETSLDFTLYDLRGDWTTLDIKKGLLKQLNKKLATKRQQWQEEAVEGERERITKLVDDVKADIYKLQRSGTLTLEGERLDLITKYQAVNMINLGGLPYTPISELAQKKS